MGGGGGGRGGYLHALPYPTLFFCYACIQQPLLRSLFYMPLWFSAIHSPTFLPVPALSLIIHACNLPYSTRREDFWDMDSV